MKCLIISNLPVVVSEKDLFLILYKLTPSIIQFLYNDIGIKRVIIADDPEICGKTL